MRQGLISFTHLPVTLRTLATCMEWLARTLDGKPDPGSVGEGRESVCVAMFSTVNIYVN